MTGRQTKQTPALRDDRDGAPVPDARIAAARKAIEAAFHARANADTEAVADARAEDFRAWRRQTIADLIGLPRLCHHRRCRRKHRCSAPGAPCIATQRDQVCDRLGTLLGYRADDLWDDDVDLTW